MDDDGKKFQRRIAILEAVAGLPASPETRRIVSRIADASLVTFDEAGLPDASRAVAEALLAADSVGQRAQAEPTPPRRGRRTPAVPPQDAHAPFDVDGLVADYLAGPRTEARLRRVLDRLPDYVPARLFPQSDD